MRRKLQERKSLWGGVWGDDQQREIFLSEDEAEDNAAQPPPEDGPLASLVQGL